MWVNPYFDFGAVNQNGEVNYQLGNSVKLTEKTIKDSGGFEASDKLSELWQTMREATSRKERHLDAASTRLDSIGKTMAANDQWKRYMFLIGKIKTSGIPLDEIEYNVVKDWLRGER